jgi:hypothetical protein
MARSAIAHPSRLVMKNGSRLRMTPVFIHGRTGTKKEKAGVAPAFAVFVIAGLVPVIHVWLRQKDSRGWPGHLREDALRALARP